MGDTRISVEQLRAATGIRLFDIRKRPSDDQIPGSEPCDGIELETGAHVPFHKDDKVVLYCGSGTSCSRIADMLGDRGYDVRALEGGYAAWIDAGMPTEQRSY